MLGPSALEFRRVRVNQDALAEPIISKTDLQTFVRRTLPDYTGCTLLAQVISEAGSF